MSETPSFVAPLEPPPPPPPPRPAGGPGGPAHSTTGVVAVGPPRPAVLMLALVVGVLGERSLSAVAPGLNWSATALALVGLIAVAARRRGGRARSAGGLLAVATAFSLAWSWRGTPWLVVPDVLIAVGAALVATTFAQGGSWWTVQPNDLAARLLAPLLDLGGAPSWVRHGLASRTARPTSDGDGEVTSGRWVQRLTGALVALPVVAVLGALLASADASFARVVDPAWWKSPVRITVVVLLVAWVSVAIARSASRHHVVIPATSLSGSATSGNVVLAAVAGTFALFAATRLVTLSTLEQRVRDTRGVTWSGEARSGFFQLMAVAAITLVVLLGVRVGCAGGPTSSHRWQRRLTLANCALILVIVGTAVARLWAYQERFGWTMLRLATTISALWFGVVFLIVAVATVVGRERSRWLTAALVTSAVVVIGGANLTNPAGFVASSNLARAVPASPTDLDIDYLLGSLGDDGLPALADAADRLTPDQLAVVRAEVCHRPSTRGWWRYQWSRHEADRAAARICRT